MISPDKVKPHLMRVENSVRKNIIKLVKIDNDEHKKSKFKALPTKIFNKNEANLK